VSRWIGETKNHQQLRVIVRCKHERTVLRKSFTWLWSYIFCFYIQVMQEIGGMYYTTKYDMVEDGLTECALNGNPGG
jgi:hypothetical protein